MLSQDGSRVGRLRKLGARRDRAVEEDEEEDEEEEDGHWITRHDIVTRHCNTEEQRQRICKDDRI